MLKSYELMGFISPGLAKQILDFAYESDKPTYKTVLAAVAQARHLRPVFLERQERTQRHAAMLATLARPSLDLVAGTLLRAWLVQCAWAAIRAGKDVALVGAGNIHYGAMLRVPLTTISWSRREMGQNAANLLIQMIEGKSKDAKPEQIILPLELIIRDSCGARAKATSGARATS